MWFLTTRYKCSVFSDYSRIKRGSCFSPQVYGSAEAMLEKLDLSDDGERPNPKDYYYCTVIFAFSGVVTTNHYTNVKNWRNITKTKTGGSEEVI